jgi:extracellular elastinolytic metalloproteinase
MSRSVAFTASLSCALALLWSSAAASQGVADSERHYDARIDYNAAFIASQRALPAQTNNAFAANLEEASVEADAATGAVSALTSQSGYLTEKASGTPMTLAMSFLRNNLTALGLEAADLQGYAVTDVVYSKITGATHVYLQQQYRGIPVYNAQLHINVNRDGPRHQRQQFLPAGHRTRSAARCRRACNCLQQSAQPRSSPASRRRPN